MIILYIEHPIRDLNTWQMAFSRFAEARQNAGVCNERIYQPIDDDKYIIVELDFKELDGAMHFKKFLEANVWSSPEASPGLAGVPKAKILKRVVTDN